MHDSKLESKQNRPGRSHEDASHMFAEKKKGGGMSWVDQCKIAFKTSADALRWKKKKAIDEIIKAMSRESNIPIQTLRFWYYETEVGKTTLTCKSCGERPVLIRAKTIKPYGPKSKFYGLCSTCKSKKEKEN